MQPKHHHDPSSMAAPRVRCPVCREPVYSRAGIHPQCAVRQDDPPRAKPKPPAAPAPAALVEIPPDAAV